MESVPTIRLTHLNDTQKRAYRIADNKIALRSTWDMALLAEEVRIILDSSEVIDLGDVGFVMGEIDSLIFVDDAKMLQPGEAVPMPDRSRPAIAQPGDLFAVGEHRIYCGDSLKHASFSRLMGDRKAAAVVTDMPWNVPVNGHVSGLGKIKHPEFQMASGELSSEEFRQMMHDCFLLQAQWAKPGALHYQFIDWRSVAAMIDVGEAIHDRLLNLAVWVKPNGGMGSFLRSRHELCCIFRGKGGRHNNFVELGKHGRYRTNVWEYPAPSGFGPERKKLAMHPTCKNTQMISDAIMDSTKIGDITLDPFLGSGTTALAAAKCGRVGYGIEIDPYYVDIAVDRLARQLGVEPILSSKEINQPTQF